MTQLPRIVFMGSPDFAVPTLEALAKRYPLAGVVTQPDRPAGRGQGLVPPAVKEAALRLGIPVMQPEKLRLPEAMTQLQAWAPDCIVVAAFGQILRPVVLDLPRYGCINVHGSLLPRWRGAAPIQASILKKEDGLLDFARPAIDLERLVRAMDPWPGAYFDWNGAPLKVLCASIREAKSPGVGRRLTVEGCPAVGTYEGILILEEVQPAGKKSMPGKAFLIGARDW